MLRPADLIVQAAEEQTVVELAAAVAVVAAAAAVVVLSDPSGYSTGHNIAPTLRHSGLDSAYL